jgi:hypothetical protein
MLDKSTRCFINDWIVRRSQRAVGGRAREQPYNRVCGCAVKVEFNHGFCAKNAKLDRVFAHFGAFSGCTVAVCANPCAKLVNPHTSPSIAKEKRRRSAAGAPPHG